MSPRTTRHGNTCGNREKESDDQSSHSKFAVSKPAEHIYENGGHGFGMRPRVGAPGSKDWSGRAVEWLRLHKFAAEDRDAAVENQK